jgi:hypothetical protein
LKNMVFIGPLPVGRVLNDLLASPEVIVIGRRLIEFYGFRVRYLEFTLFIMTMLKGELIINLLFVIIINCKIH